MKKILSIMSFLLIWSIGGLQAQTLVDFETGPYTTEGFGGTVQEITDNVSTTGINSTAKVYKISKGGETWAGAKVTELPAMDFSTNEGISIMVYSPRAGASLMLKLEGGGIGDVERIASTTVANQWEVLKFDFSGVPTGKTDLVFFFDFQISGDNSDNFTFFVDEVKQIDLTASPEATLTSLKYNNVDAPGFHPAQFNYDVELDLGTTAVPTIAATTTDNNASTVITDALGLPGTSTIEVTAEDGISSITYSINFSVVQPLAVPGKIEAEDWHTKQGDIQDTETAQDDGGGKVVGYFDADEWVAYTVDVQQTAEYDVSFRVAPGGDGTKTIDLYANDNSIGTVSFDDKTSWQGWITVNTKVNLDAGIQTIKVYNVTGGFNFNWFSFVDADLAANTDAKLTDLTLDGLTVDGFSSEQTNYSVVLTPGAAIPTIAATLSNSEATITSITNATAIPGTSTVLVTAKNGVTTMTYKVNISTIDAAPTPDELPFDVISFFSNAYTNIENVNFNPAWGQATVQSIEDINDNATLKYANLNYQGTTFNNTDVSDMDYLHVDMWTADAVVVRASIISPGNETAYTMPITQGQWVSYYIPLSHYSGVVDLTNVFQFKFDTEGTPGNFDFATIYLDNLYFYKEVDETTDTRLKDLKVNGITIPGFDVDATIYSFELPVGTTAIPTVTATPAQATASVTSVTPPSDLPGATTVEITAQDGSTTQTYTINFNVATQLSDDASLSSLKVNGESVNGFAADKLEYTVFLDYGTTTIPTVTATPTHLNATADITHATAIPGATTILVTAEDDSEQVYTINFGYDIKMIPGRIEAEAWNDMNGVDTEDTQDIDGNKNVGWTDADDWIEYLVDVETAGEYEVSFRVASDNDGDKNIELFADGTSLGTLTFDYKNGWQGWTVVKETFSLEAGVQTLKLVFVNGGVNFNWFSFADANMAANSDAALSDLIVGGESIEGFDPLTLSYEYGLPVGADVPTVDATTSNPSAEITSITDATAVPGATTILVTAVDGNTQQIYTVNFVEIRPIEFPIDFEDPNLSYNFLNWSGNSASIGEDPVDANNNVLIVSDGSDAWSGTVVGGDVGLANPVPFTSTLQKLTMDVYSPAAGVRVLLKFEELANADNNCEVFATTTKANEWETLMFDFANDASDTKHPDLSIDYQKVVVIFNAGAADNGDKTYYADNIIFAPVVPVSTISVSPATLNLDITETAQLSVTFDPVDASDQGVTWESSDELIANVSNDGFVVPLSAGTVTITATSNDGSHTASCTIQIVDTDIEKANKNLVAKVYPTPSTGLVNIAMEGISGCEVSVFDVAGKAIRLRNISKQDNLMSFSIATEGVYFLQIIRKDQILTKKIMIQK